MTYTQALVHTKKMMDLMDAGHSYIHLRILCQVRGDSLEEVSTRVWHTTPAFN